MGYIPAETVEAAWRKVGAMEPAEAADLQRKSGSLQPELTGFAIAFTSDLRPDAMGLAMYMMLVVYEMFRMHHGKLRKAREAVVVRQWESARDNAASLRDSGATRESLVAADIATTEPFALQYVIDALTERPEDDPIDISDEEFWHTFAVLRTIVETLHEVANPAGKARRPRCCRPGILS